MNSRDELATIIGEQFEHPPGPACSLCEDIKRAAAAVETMGYRKPRTITTSAELDELPVDSVLKDRVGDIYERVESPDADRYTWRVPGLRGELVTASILLPATVLYEPEATK